MYVVLAKKNIFAINKRKVVSLEILRNCNSVRCISVVIDKRYLEPTKHFLNLTLNLPKVTDYCVNYDARLVKVLRFDLFSNTLKYDDFLTIPQTLL